MIRSANLEDIETLFQIRTSVRQNYQSRQELAALGVTPETVAEMLQTTCKAWIAVEEQPIGFSMADSAEATVFGLFILPAFEAQGWGRALMQQAETWLWSTVTIDTIWLLTDNDPAVRAYGFYQHLGWIPTEIQADGQIKFVKQRSRSQ